MLQFERTSGIIETMASVNEPSAAPLRRKKKGFFEPRNQKEAKR